MDYENGGTVDLLEDKDTTAYNHFKKEPEINVIPKEEFEKRTEKVFHLLWETLSRSFGPYGAPTIIYNYPFNHVTKDGYTIMKNISMNVAESRIDEAIKSMAADICGRLNYSVGDGTTSAIIATNSIYKMYREQRDEFKSRFILPRDVLHKYEKIKDEVINQLDMMVRPIQSDDRNVLRQNIHDVVYISSNGDDTFTDYIADLYYELGSPSITCRMSPDGVTRKTLINGYRYELSLNDRLYINNDDNTMSITNADVVILGTKVTSRTYEYILKPLNNESRVRGRNLIVVAPTYDVTTLEQVIAPALNDEFKRTHKVNMVLTTYRAISAHTRKLVNDFAILMNTIVIDRSLEERIISEVTSGVNINQIFRIDSRNIEGLKCIAFRGDQSATYLKGLDDLPEGITTLEDSMPLVENPVDLGYIKKCSLGLKESLFTDMVYDEERYKVALKEAIDDLDEKEKKYQKLGTFNVEVSQAQERYYALNLKMGIIEVGADSELSQALIKDAVDDAIKAASSAYKYGVVSGCNLNLIQSIYTLWKKEEDPTNKLLLDILRKGFINVYSTVLRNAFDDIEMSSESTDEVSKEFKEFIDSRIEPYENIFEDDEKLYDAIKLALETDGKATVHNIIINYSIITSKVFDVSNFRYSNDVVNSVQTDKEILKATIDLMSLLVTGNQVVITQKDY